MGQAFSQAQGVGNFLGQVSPFIQQMRAEYNKQPDEPAYGPIDNPAKYTEANARGYYPQFPVPLNPGQPAPAVPQMHQSMDQGLYQAIMSGRQPWAEANQPQGVQKTGLSAGLPTGSPYDLNRILQSLGNPESAFPSGQEQGLAGATLQSGGLDKLLGQMGGQPDMFSGLSGLGNSQGAPNATPAGKDDKAIQGTLPWLVDGALAASGSVIGGASMFTPLAPVAPLVGMGVQGLANMGRQKMMDAYGTYQPKKGY